MADIAILVAEEYERRIKNARKLGSSEGEVIELLSVFKATEYSEPSTGSEIVSVEQKKRKVAGEDGSAGSVVIDTWHSLFEGAKAWSFVCPYSDHLPIMITPEVVRRAHRRSRFCFDNMWLKEIACREIVEHSWDKTLGLDVLTRITVCSHDIWR
nr:uncharacterized protein LOC109162267 [Ipomoea batatas]